MGDTGGMDGPDARLAFLEAVMDPDKQSSGYTADQMTDPEKYMALVAQAYPMYLKALKVRLLHHQSAPLELPISRMSMGAGQPLVGALIVEGRVIEHCQYCLCAPLQCKEARGGASPNVLVRTLRTLRTPWVAAGKRCIVT